MKSLRIRIVGGSLAGLFAGVLLQRDGHDVCIYERSRHGLGGRGAGLVAQHEVLRMLRLIGCEHVARIGVVAKERTYLERTRPQRQQGDDRTHPAGWVGSAVGKFAEPLVAAAFEARHD